MQIVIDIPEHMKIAYEDMIKHCNYETIEVPLSVIQSIVNGTPLPENHGDLIDKTEILRFLKCPKYENCDWKNCFDCNESRCINLNNVNSLVPIIRADKEQY